MSGVTSISVVVRLRCMNQREKNYKAKLCVDIPDENTITMIDPKATNVAGAPPRKFQFDHALWSFSRDDEDKDQRPFADQVYVYERTGKPLLENALKGFNSCLFAYGQTGSGKSYSVMGCPEDPGVIPQLCGELFQRAAAMSETHSIAVECSYLEIYNENVKDLLNPAGLNKTLKVRQHPKLGVFVEGLKKMAARSADEIARYVDDGTQVRTIASTNMNATSSRSHAILTLSIRVKSAETETMSVLHLVDLAGSERAASTGAEGQTLKEGANINKSLSVLGMCLSRLADQCDGGKKGGHIPFRDSQLTFLLNDALGGNSKTTMLAAISPADINFEETLSTLRFASITKKIKMIVKINEDPQQKIIRELREQIGQIKDEIKALAEGRVASVPRPPPDAVDEEGNEVDPMAVDGLPQEMDVDIRRAQLLEELEQNTNLMTEWTMTDEQRAEKDDAEREAHEQQMEELKKGSGGAGSSVEETSPKLLVLNEDMRMLRGADGSPIPLVHTMVRPPTATATSTDRAASADSDGLVVAPSSASRARSQSLVGARSRNYTTMELPHVFTAVGPDAASSNAAATAAAANQQKKLSAAEEDEPEPSPAAGTGGPWMRLPAASGLAAGMHIDFIVDFQERTITLEFHGQGDIVFINGRPIRLIAESSSWCEKKPCGNDGGSSSKTVYSVSLRHNDRVIVGQVVFRVFEPLAWRAEAEGGEDETFQTEAVSTEHLELLENFERLGIEEGAFEALTAAIYGDESDDSTSTITTKLSPRGAAGSAANVLQSGAAEDDAVSVNAAQVRSNLEAFSSLSRFARAEAEEELIARFPRDVKRELRTQDVQDALGFDGAFALKERQQFIEEKKREEEEVRKKLKDLEAEGERLQGQMEEQERQREEAARKAKEEADRAAQEQVKRAEELAKQKLETAAKSAGQSGAANLAVATMKQTAQSKLAIARKVHEYEELRRELLLWKPAGPTDPRDRPTYSALSAAITSGKNVPTYIAVRGMFQGAGAAGANEATSAVLAAAMTAPDDHLLPTFEAQIFKNRIKTGFFSRGGLHPVTFVVLGHFLFYFDPGAALQPPTAANTKMMGFAYIVGCELEVIADVEKKPALRVVSCAPRKEGQGKTDAHHPLEFAFTSIEQREAAMRAINAVRLPVPDPDVAAALAQLDS